ncbi:MAG: hypothetical protein H7145_23740 [Akkermansiaceae bacterium]|nr:hypothetical protein [Armatimonadota bacterium]
MSENTETDGDVLPTPPMMNRASIEEIAGARPKVQVYTFPPDARFEEGALAPLEGATQLRVLAFHDSTLSGRDLMSLTRLPALTSLDLRGCRFAAGDFRAFCDALAGGGSPKPSRLWLEDTPVADDDLGAVAGLRWVILSGTKITDAGLTHLLTLRKLETLWLDRTDVSDTGVFSLAVLANLSGIPTRQTRCSPDVADRLFQAQLALQAPKSTPDEAQVTAASARLYEFLGDIDEWSRLALERNDEIKSRAESLQRTQPDTPRETFTRAREESWSEIVAKKAEIVGRYCTQEAIRRGAGDVRSFGGDPVLPQIRETGWASAETPSKVRTVFVNGGAGSWNRHRYAMKWESGEWRVDEVHYWYGGWKRDSI